MHFPNSVGLLYSTITSYLGFRVNNDEYKVMGLAAYGEPKYEKEFKKIVKINDDGSIKLNMKYFSFEDSKRMFNIKLEKLLGKKRLYKEPITQRHKDIAYALQKITEKIVLKMVNFSHKETNSKNLCLAGGVALNSVSNGNIEQNSKFKNIFIQPASSDSGGAIGVAQYIHHSILKNERKNKMDHIFFGPDYKSKNIRQFLIKNNIKYVEYKKKKLLEKTASLIWNNNVIGWFQGRMEFGPRALGNRSILANPSNPKMKDIINKKVKHRESFRPFAPACLLNKAKDYFDIKTESPFMLKICTVKSNKRKILPSITHIDGTARLQTVKKSNNEKFYDLIVQFEKLSKIPVLLNTSFNVMGEPIVNSPQDAYDCFKNTGIDYLIMENFIIEKNQINNYNNNNNK